MRVLALDIGGTKIASAIVEDTKISNRQQIETPHQDVRQGMYQSLAKIMDLYKGQYDCVAVASTGIINNGILTALNPQNLGGLAEFPLKQSIVTYTDKPIGLLNDAQAATCAEYKQQDQSKIENFAFITVSTGVGGGIIFNHQLLTGPRGIAGHIGHTLADPNGPICGCGRIGCVEAVASGRAIEAGTSQWKQPASPKEVFELFRQGDIQASKLVHQSAKAIANLIANLVISLDIQKVTVGGSVGLAEDYLPLVKQYLEQMPKFYHCEVEPAY